MGINILLADDSITIQKVIGIIFGGDEYSVTVVDNGKAAVDKAIEIKPDVLLIDALMPGMSGYEVCEQIRAISELKTKPIILLTGSFEPFDEEKAKNCGADTFLSKPFESQQIVNKVAEMYELGLSRSSAAKIVEPVAAVLPPPIPEELPAAVEPESIAAPNDIWGAFTPPEELKEPLEEVATPVSAPEPEIEIEQPVIADEEAAEQIGSQWVPVEEHTFEFEEETLVVPADTAWTDTPKADDLSFGEVPFEEPAELASHEEVPVEAEIEAPAEVPVEAEIAAPAEAEIAVPVVETAFTEKAMPEILASIPTFDEPGKSDFVRSAALSVVHPGPAIESPFAAVESSTAPGALTEEQLKAALALVSKDVIERIVWEVVPDLAEAMIKEAIRRIKEGQ